MTVKLHYSNVRKEGCKDVVAPVNSGHFQGSYEGHLTCARVFIRGAEGRVFTPENSTSRGANPIQHPCFHPAKHLLFSHSTPASTLPAP